MARSGVIYGPTGTYKTTQIKWFAHYIARKTGKATALISCDGGGWDSCQEEVDDGMIIPFRVEMSAIPLPLIVNISRGYWPKDVKEAEPSKIVLKRMPFDDIGAIAIEGWSSISQVAMRYMPDAGISVGGEDRNKLGGWNQSMNIDFDDGRGSVLVPSHFRSNTRGDYGFVQKFIYGITMNFNSLPLEYALYTALENKTEDEDRVTVYGPEIAGKKATANCGPWVGDMIHCQDYITYNTPAGTDTPVASTEVRYYYERHQDPRTNVPFPAKFRAVPAAVPKIRARWPGGFFKPNIEGTESFGAFLQSIDDLGAIKTDAMKPWREKMDAKRRGAAIDVAPVTQPTKALPPAK